MPSIQSSDAAHPSNGRRLRLRHVESSVRRLRWTPARDQGLTLEGIGESVKDVKRNLHWTQTSVKIHVGLDKEEVEFDKIAMRKTSTYFSNFSLPTIAFAEDFARTTDRLLNLTSEEVGMLEWIFEWCSQPVNEGTQLYENNINLNFDQWCYVWSLTGALHIPRLRRLSLEAVRHKCDREDTLPPATAIQYLYELEHHHDAEKETLWDELVIQHKLFPESPISSGTPHSFVQAFVDDVLKNEGSDSSSSDSADEEEE